MIFRSSRACGSGANVRPERAADHADGSLEQMMLSGQSGSLIAAAKAAAHWTVTGAPLVLVAPLIGLLLVSRRFSARSASSRRLPAFRSAAALEFGRAVQRDEHGHLRLEDDRLVRLEHIVGRPGRVSLQHALTKMIGACADAGRARIVVRIVQAEHRDGEIQSPRLRSLPCISRIDRDDGFAAPSFVGRMTGEGRQFQFG